MSSELSFNRQLDAISHRFKKTRGQRKTSTPHNGIINASVSDNFSLDQVFNSGLNGYRLIVNRDYFVIVKPDNYLYSINRHNGEQLRIGYLASDSVVSFQYLPDFDTKLNLFIQNAILDCVSKNLETDDKFYEYCSILGINDTVKNDLLYAQVEQWSKSQKNRIIKRAFKLGIDTNNVSFDDTVKIAILYKKLCASS